MIDSMGTYCNDDDDVVRTRMQTVKETGKIITAHRRNLEVCAEIN